MTARVGVDLRGVKEIVYALKGPLFRNVNFALREESVRIAKPLAPLVSAAVAASGAPQGRDMAPTVRVIRDRTPVVAIGKTNPKLSKFSRRGARKDGRPRADVKRRRGALAHGVVYGPLGGRRTGSGGENYYRIGRDNSGGRVGRVLDYGGPVFEKACDEYLAAFFRVMESNGWGNEYLRRRG